MEIHPNVMMSCILQNKLTKKQHRNPNDLLLQAIGYTEKNFKNIPGADKKDIVIRTLTGLKDFIPPTYQDEYNLMILGLDKTIDLVVSIANNKNFKVFVKKCLH
jgi:hypothetical protein